MADANPRGLIVAARKRPSYDSIRLRWDRSTSCERGRIAIRSEAGTGRPTNAVADGHAGDGNNIHYLGPVNTNPDRVVAAPKWANQGARSEVWSFQINDE